MLCFADVFCGAEIRFPGRTGTGLGISALKTTRLGRSWVCRVLRCDFAVVSALFLESMRRFNREFGFVQNRKSILISFESCPEILDKTAESLRFSASILYSCERKRKQPLWEIQLLIRKL